MATNAFELARQTLCLALDALGEQSKAVILVGAQAVYLHTSHFELPVAPFTTDADILLDATLLGIDPSIAKAMELAGFTLGAKRDAVGTWFSPSGVEVDLMMANSQSGSGRREARVMDHGRGSIRKTTGLESALHDSKLVKVDCITEQSKRPHEIAAAGPAALLVAKLHKISDRRGSARLRDKDAYDIYRLLLAIPTQVFREALVQLLSLPGPSAEVDFALKFLTDNFASSPEAFGPVMAGRAESLLGNSEQVQNRLWALSNDLLDELG